MNFSNFQKRAIINVAKSIAPIKSKNNTILKKIEALKAELEANNAVIASMEATIAPFTEGKTSDAFVEVVPQATGANKYVFHEVEEVVVPVEAPVMQDEFGGFDDNEPNL